ncbi:MAG TPA: YceI family protein [Acidimicrobiales bacterium]
MSSKLKVIAVVVVLLVAAGAGGVWWYLRDDAPEEVSLDSALESANGDEEAGDGGTTTTGEDDAAGEGIEGSWVVDTESGGFDFDTATGSFVGFRIQEELSSIGSTTAVGRTGDITGGIVIDGTTVTEAGFEVDVTTIATNESRRDDKVQQALETGTFPTATFELTEPIELPAGAADGAPVSVTAVGDLTIHGVTKPVEMAMDAQVSGDRIVLVGSVDVTFSDFGVQVPSAPVVLSVDDHGTLELQLLLVRA